MSGKFYRGRQLSRRPQAFGYGSLLDVRQQLKAILDSKIHGISFSPYIAGQEPGFAFSDEQINERLSHVEPLTKWVRTFSCSDGHERIPALAKAKGLKVLVGVWLDGDFEKNEQELASGIALAQAGHVDLLAIGNEVLLREEMSQEQLIDYIERAKKAAPNVQVGYVDAYYKFETNPLVADACDVIFANCYPFWEGYPVEHALVYMKDMYQRALTAAKGKQVIISETGWPNIGSAEYLAEPSENNAIRYCVQALQWAEEENIDMFYFSSFDESWKVADEGDVGAYWGILNEHGEHKYAI